MKSLPTLFVAVLATLVTTIGVARAGVFHWDIGGGLSGATSGIPSPATVLANRNTAGNFSLMVSLSESGGPYAFHYGLHSRLSTGIADDGSDYLIAPLYATVRLQVMRFYMSVGATKAAWMQTPTHSTLALTPATSFTYAAFAEVGGLWPITPAFSLGASLGASVIRGAGIPTHTLDAQAFMRFYFWRFKTSGGDGGSSFRSREFEGWRYPNGFFGK